MKKIFYVFILFPLLPITLSKPSCFESQEAIGFFEPSAIECQHVPPSVIFEYDNYKNFSDPHDLIITNSTIPILPSNSSISKFIHTRDLILKNLGIEEIAQGAFRGLEHLRTLDLSSNKLTNLPNGIFNNLNHLQILRLDHNDIGDVTEDNLLGLIHLRELFLNDNKIAVLQQKFFERLPNLWLLNISNNPLKEFQYVGFKSLLKLSARNTVLRTFKIDLANSPIEQVDLVNSQLETIDLANFSQPTQIYFKFPTLSFSKNNISLVQNWNRVKAFYLYLDENYITQLEIPENVLYLHIQKNKIKRWVNSPTNKLLEHFDVSFNEISSIDSEMFLGMSKLQDLNLHHNQIKVLHANTFVSCKQLFLLNVSYNEIEHIEVNTFNGSVMLGFIDLSHNKLKTLQTSSFSGLSHSFFLYVDFNEINWPQIKNFLNFYAVSGIDFNHDEWSCKKFENYSRIDIDKESSFTINNINGMTCELFKRN